MNNYYVKEKKMKRLVTICTIAELTVFATPLARASLMDNFNDNSIDTSLWNLYQEDSAKVWLNETNQRLELRAEIADTSANADYYANAWGFSPKDNFSFKVEFKHNTDSLTYQDDDDWDFSVHLGLAKDGDNEVFLETGYGVAQQPSDSHSFFYCATIIDGDEDSKGEKNKAIDSGTLYMSYDADIDELYLSDTGYWKDDSWSTITNLLQNEWGGSVVFPYIGGWSDGVKLESGDAYLDNFVVDSGTVVPAPGAFLLCSMGLGLASWLNMRRSP